MKDFQVLKEISLEARGITLILGDNNQGKSSLIRAIIAALYGSGGDYFIREGQRETSVRLNFPETNKFKELSITWIKPRKKGAHFMVNGEKYTKLRKSVPDIFKKEGITEVVTSKVHARLNVWPQWESPFLLHVPGSHLFEFLSQIRKETAVLPVIADMKKDLKKLETMAFKKEGEIQSLKILVNDISRDLDDRKKVIEQLSQEEIDDLANNVDALQGILGTLKQYSYKSQVLSERNGLLKRYHSLEEKVSPELSKLQKLYEDYSSLNLVYRLLTQVISRKLRTNDNIANLKEEEEGIKKLIAEEINHIGGKCPLCGNTIDSIVV